MGIPSKEADLANWVENFSTLITATPSAYGEMASDAAAIASVVNAFLAAFALATNPATKTRATVADKNAKMATMLVTVRQYARTIKNNAGVSDQAKVGLGLTINDTTPTPAPRPSTRPVLTLVSAEPMLQILRYADSAAPDKRARPAGTRGLLLMVAVGTTPPSNPELVPLKAVATHQPFEVEFELSDKGKTAYYYARWFNGSGEMGPWSDGVSMVVA